MGPLFSSSLTFNKKKNTLKLIVLDNLSDVLGGKSKLESVSSHIHTSLPIRFLLSLSPLLLISLLIQLHAAIVRHVGDTD